MGFGLQARAYYGINEKMGVTGGLSYFFPSAPDGIDLTLFEIFADFNYNFYQTDAIKIYGLAGLNYGYAKAKIEFLGQTIEEDDSKVGVNLGVGSKYNLGTLELFGEFKYNSAFENVMFNVGVLFSL